MPNLVIPDPVGQALGISVVVLAVLALLGFVFAPDKARYVLDLMRVVLRVGYTDNADRRPHDPAAGRHDTDD